MMDDEELLDLVELELRELLTKLRLPGRRHSDHPRLGLEALESTSTDPEAPEYKCIRELMDAVDTYIPTPSGPATSPS